ncbi:hypothetical protein [Vibrio furnissii]|uniref:hypothetical protein n=1 Tax=Vibrio furnissii TaxID=29494 RepID=UPI0015593F5C|nr:hypothetical protein [Vibrio furnissii]
MENNTTSLHLENEISSNLSKKLKNLSNTINQNSSPHIINNTNIDEFISLSKRIISQLEHSQGIYIKYIYDLEVVLRKLTKLNLLDIRFNKNIEETYNQIKNISESIDINNLLDIDDIDPELAKTILLKNKSNSLSDGKSSYYKEIESDIHRQLATIKSDFIASISSELSKVEQNAIKRMLDQSNKRLEELRKVQDGSLQSFNDSVQDNIDNISNRIETEVGKFESRREDMDQLLEQVGLAKDAEVTISQANKEEKRADDFRKYGIGFLYASILVLVFMFSEYIGLNTLWGGAAKNLSDLTLEAFIIRFMTVTLISSPAIYMLKESASHRAKENLYRQRGTQLLTIRGYLSDLPDAQRTEVKKQLASNFFSFHNGKTDTSNVPDFIKNMNEAIKLAHAFRAPPIEKSEKESHPK